MTRPVLYVCHPVGGDVDGNIKRALRWLSWLSREHPAITFVMPWLAGVLAGDDGEPAQREAGLRDCEATVAKLDGVVLVGGRVSTGMARERAVAIDHGLEVFDLYCTNPDVIKPVHTNGRRDVGDTCWDTPMWCPLLAMALRAAKDAP